MRAVTAGLVALAVALGSAECTGNDDPNLAEVSARDFEAWTTMARLADADSITVGVTGDQVDAEGTPVGFEVEIAKLVAGALGIPAHEIGWVEVEHRQRERLIEDGHVDMVVAALPWDDAAGEIIGLAGPYHVGEHRVLVPRGTGSVTAGTVCVADDVPEEAVRTLPDTPVERAGATECLELLRAGEVDAAYGPDLAFAGVVGDHFALLDEPRVEQAYGIGVAKGDAEFRAFIDEIVDAAIQDGRWATAWESTAGPVLGPADPPSPG
ncbi:MAG: transporter substrate-binding domain-containing protein [Actinomycetota bacterium]